MRPMHHAATALALCAALALSAPLEAQPRSRADWIALAKGGFALPPNERAIDVLIEANALLASPDPVLRDDVAFSAAERWVARDRVVAPEDLRRLMALWTANLEDGLGTAGDDRIFRRSFSALSLSLIAARDVATPFLTSDEAQRLFERLLDYFQRERDLRGFDAAHGWMHAVAHTSDAFKFLARGRHWQPANLPRLLEAIRAKIAAASTVFVWGETDRMALALQAAVRRSGADVASATAWIGRWEADHTALWAHGPQVEPGQFARVENAKQLLRSLQAALAMDQAPTTEGEAIRRATVATLARMR